MAQKLKDTGQRTCEVCNNYFSRVPGYPVAFFDRKRTCSPECYGVLRKQNVVGFKKGHTPFSDKGRFEKGQIPWNKGIHIQTNNALAKYQKRKKYIPHNKGKKLSIETIEKIKLARANQDPNSFRRGVSHPAWKGGLTKLRKLVQNLYLYKEWRKSVFKRDDYTCQMCGVKGAYIHADHIKPYSKIIKDNNITTVEEAKLCAELWDILNGRTLCVPCHKATDSYAGKSKS